MILENPLPFRMHHDWSRMRRIYHKLIKNYYNNFFDDNERWISNGRHTACDIGIYGRLAYSCNLTEDCWFFWSGKMVESLIPCTSELKEKAADSGILLQNFAYHCHYGNISKHVDSKELKDISFQKNQCNLNFIITSQDKQSISCFEHDDGIHYYTGKENSAYLMDSSVPHWVTNNGFREIFQIRFHSSYDSVKNFFNLNPITLV